MVARAGLGIDAEALLDDALAIRLRLGAERLLAALLVEHALGRSDDDLGPLGFCRQRLFQRVAHGRDVGGARERAHPLDANAADCPFDRMLRRADIVAVPGGEEILPTGGRRVA